MADITLDQLTSGTLSGNGAFDKLMAAVKAHLTDEYSNNRIKGSEYAEVYLGSLNAVMAQAVQFLLQEQISDNQADLLAQQTANAATQNTLMLRQIDKLAAEIALLEQKTRTEKAQILDQVDAAPVVGVIGKQKNLYQAQTDGFQRDAEQKVLKTLIDTWSVRRTTDEGTTVSGNGLSDANIKAVVDKAREGIGLNASL